MAKMKMSTKVGIGIGAAVVAAGVGYYFYQKSQAAPSTAGLLGLGAFTARGGCSPAGIQAAQELLNGAMQRQHALEIMSGNERESIEVRQRASLEARAMHSEIANLSHALTAARNAYAQCTSRASALTTSHYYGRGF